MAPPRKNCGLYSLNSYRGPRQMSGRGIEYVSSGKILGANIMSDRGIESLESLHHDGCVAFGAWPSVRGLWCVAWKQRQLKAVAG
jgi:hypothetical protein